MPGNNSLAFSSDGRLMASADKDRTIRFWDTTTGELKRTLKDGVGWVKTLAFSPDGRRIAFGGTNGRIQFRNLDPEGSQQHSDPQLMKRAFTEIPRCVWWREPRESVTHISESRSG